jgi:hypothetical protein
VKTVWIVEERKAIAQHGQTFLFVPVSQLDLYVAIVSYLERLQLRLVSDLEASRHTKEDK